MRDIAVMGGVDGETERDLRLDLSLKEPPPLEAEEVDEPLIGGTAVVACEASEVSEDVKPPSAVREPE